MHQLEAAFLNGNSHQSAVPTKANTELRKPVRFVFQGMMHSQH